MTTDNWLQTWHPPASIAPHPHQNPLYVAPDVLNFNLTHDVTIHHRNRVNRPDNFLPYLLSLTMVKPDRGYRYRESKYEQRLPPTQRLPPMERTGPFHTWYQWSVLDFVYPSKIEHDEAILFEDFIPKNNLPLGLEVYKDRMFVTMPKWKPGVPATLAVLPRIPKERSPALVPYPDWSWHKAGTCEGITSVFRVQADSCGRLWVLDSGLIHVTVNPKQLCHPQLLIFDMETDELLTKYVFPAEFIKEDGLYSNILVDIRDNDCENVHAYFTDVWRFALVVFSLEKMRAWRITDHLFYPDPLAARYKLHHLEFDWTDGLFGLSLSPYNKYYPDRTLYFHPMSGFREFYVKTSVICNETGWADVKDAFKVMGQSRGSSGHVSSSWMDRNGIMFYNLVTRDSVGCWDSRKPYKRSNLGVVAKSSETLVFPNDIKIDQEPRQSIWVLSNWLPYYLYEGLKEDKINFRIMSAYTDEAIRGTICDPNVATYDTFVEYESDEDCY